MPSGPINTIDGGFAMAERFGLDPVVEVGEGDRAVPDDAHPIRFSATPVALSAAAARARRARRGAAQVADRPARRTTVAEQTERHRVPDRARRLVA